MSSNIAFIFPGQGAQYVGMGRDFYEAFPESRAVIDEADRILGNGLKDVMFNGPEDQLTDTSYCQPAILAVSIAAWKALRLKFPRLDPAFVAGLSLGEYSAVTASGALSFADTVRLVERRGFFMQEAAVLKKGAMAAVIGLDAVKIKVICDQCRVEVANFNAPDQTVITGEADKIETACAQLAQAGAKRVVPLSVSGAFHSSLMKPASDRFVSVLEQAPFINAMVPIVGNVAARPCVTPEAIQNELAQQITSSVQWVKTIEFMAAQGVTRFLEIGPGKVLKGLLRRINKDLDVQNIESIGDLDTFVN